MLDTSFPHILKREKTLPGTALSLGALELWSDDFEDKGQFCQYRSRLVSLMGIYMKSYSIVYPIYYFFLLLTGKFCYGTYCKEFSTFLNLFIICI